MHVLDYLLSSLALLSSPGPTSLWAYIGLGPGQEFIPQFVALLSLAATALLAVLQWPISALLSRLAARKKARSKE